MTNPPSSWTRNGTPATGSGQVTAPAAGATIASITLAPGEYLMEIGKLIQSGAKADANNLRFRNLTTGTDVFALLLVSADGYPFTSPQFMVQTAKPVTLAVQAIAAGGNNAVYGVTISAIPISL